MGVKNRTFGGSNGYLGTVNRREVGPEGQGFGWSEEPWHRYGPQGYVELEQEGSGLVRRILGPLNF